MKKILVLIFYGITFFMPIFAEMQYIEIDSIQNATIIKIKSLTDFESLISKNNVATAYLQTSSKDVLVNIGGTYFSFPLKGYASIHDYKAGELAGYKDGAEYNESKLLGLPTVDLYYFYKRNNFQSVADCMDASKNGFSTRDQLETNKTNQESNAYYKAKELGYTKYADYKEYLEFTGLGYKTKTDWQNASAKGFSQSREFYEAQDQGFENYDDYRKAHSLGLNTNVSFKKYTAAVTAIDTLMQDKSLDKKSAIMYYFIQTLPKGEMSLSVLIKNLQGSFDQIENDVRQALNSYASETTITTGQAAIALGRSRYNYNRADIYTFFTESNLRDFFAKVNINQIGSYSNQSEIFKRK